MVVTNFVSSYNTYATNYYTTIVNVGGSADYSHRVLAHGWSVRGFKSIEGVLHNSAGRPVATPEEEDLFRIAGVAWVPPENRTIESPNAGAETPKPRKENHE